LLSTLNNKEEFFFNWSELNRMAKKEWTCNVCRRWPCSNHREHLENLVWLWGQLS
jgi:hypothetical protein